MNSTQQQASSGSTGKRTYETPTMDMIPVAGTPYPTFMFVSGEASYSKDAADNDEYNWDGSVNE